MSIDIRLPNITAKDAEGQLKQLQSYMHQLVEQLNWALNTIEAGGSNAIYINGKQASDSDNKKTDPTVTFNDIKGLIIKSADIVTAYYEEINRRLSGIYVAESKFGTFSEETSNLIKENSSSIESIYSNIQQIITDIENVEHTLIEVNAHIKSGLLYYDDSGAPVYGLEIGQRTEIDGTEVFNKYARFTSDKLSFYDSNDNEVAYISDKKLYITHVEVIGSFTLGGFVDTVLSDGSVITRWIPGGVR